MATPAALTPDARLAEIVADIADVLDGTLSPHATADDWAAALRAVYAISGYTDRGNTPVGDEGAWHVLYRTCEAGAYGRPPTADRIEDALEALDIIAAAPASLQTPIARQDFAAWCLSHGGQPFAFVTPASVGLTNRGGYRASEMSDG